MKDWDLADVLLGVSLALVLITGFVMLPITVYYEVVTAPALEVELMQMRIDAGCCQVGCE